MIEYLMLSQIIQTTMFILGSALLIYSGKQDNKTRNPFLLIPALMALGLSAGITTFLIITLASAIIFFLPQKVNKLIGKADLLLFYSLFTIIILNQNLILTLITFLSLGLTLIIMLFKKKLEKDIPLIHYYTQGYLITLIIIIGLGIGILIGVVL